MNETAAVQREIKSTGKQILYAFPRLSTSIVLGVESWALLTLYTSGFGLEPLKVGFALAMGYLTIALAQFLFGWLSDAKYTKYGRRKPYILIFSPLLGLSIIFLLLPGLFLPSLGDTDILFVWLLIWDIVFRASYAVTTPYQAWMAEQFKVSERPKVSQIQNYFNYIGSGVQGIVTILILTSFISALEIDVNAPIPIDLLIPVLLFLFNPCSSC